MRYLPLNGADRAQMLAQIGVGAIDDLFRDIPERHRLKEPMDRPGHAGELEVERLLSAMAGKNTAAGDVPFFIGGGAYKHHVPASVDHLIQRSEFLTSYTPYQPEISQGTLQYLFEFQTQIAQLFAMDVANASMYDGSTACGEAVLMAHRITRRAKAVVSGNLHPQYRAVIENLAHFAGHEVDNLPPSWDGGEDLLSRIDDRTSCVVVQSPGFYGNLVDLRPVAEAAHGAGALLIAVVPEIVSLGALIPPGEMAADIVVGEGQSLGVGLNFGGPYVGLFATRDKFIRQMPGRLAGETVDSIGRRSYVLTLSAREQHIRREKATSNICTNSGLCALACSIHLTLLGEFGLRRLAAINHAHALDLAKRLSDVPGVKILNDTFFNEFTITTPKPGRHVIDALADLGVLGGVPVSRLEPDRPQAEHQIIVASTEVNTEADRARYGAALKEVLA